MKLYEMIQRVQSKEELISFISELRSDLVNRNESWENPTLERYLEAMEAWLTDSGDTDEPSWSLLANLLYGSKIYE